MNTNINSKDVAKVIVKLDIKVTTINEALDHSRWCQAPVAKYVPEYYCARYPKESVTVASNARSSNKLALLQQKIFMTCLSQSPSSLLYFFQMLTPNFLPLASSARVKENETKQLSDTFMLYFFYFNLLKGCF